MSDNEVELWFARHREDVSSIPLALLLEVAEWLSVIGIPANDRRASGTRYLQSR